MTIWKGIATRLFSMMNNVRNYLNELVICWTFVPLDDDDGLYSGDQELQTDLLHVHRVHHSGPHSPLRRHRSRKLGSNFELN